ncbi:hypothetical protein E2562_009808 [Oryza meyeriana var. granulata]|uniref:Uncharacterized protein n=1 Tax=Oryza meyeriana var. granulata TaxID=110450 RepID=A0A6G1BU71_9ORYZ|nr:hypothetical protein E2562_009808 [Oryza meyeriana var. granulata]
MALRQCCVASKRLTALTILGLRQFGSDFAMIQHLFPDKSRNQLNIEDVQPDILAIHMNKRVHQMKDRGNKNMSGEFINEEEIGSNWPDKELDMHRSEVEENEYVSTNADDDLGDVFDWLRKATFCVKNNFAHRILVLRPLGYDESSSTVSRMKN